jgi:outer membrane lipoprotein SlyB
MKKNMVPAILCGGLLLLIGGCARNISSTTYDAKTLGAASETHPCVVVSVRKVMVEEGERLEDNKLGALAGGVAGGVLGSQVGGGNARYVTGALGALAGGVGGAYAEKALKSQEAYEYVVRLEEAKGESLVINKTKGDKVSHKTIERKSGGSLRTVVQGTDVYIAPGSPAYLMIDPNGRSRVVAR